MKIIYDIGSNNGDDIPYYLSRSDKVVAVEANPLLCETITHRFPEAIRSRCLVVENCIVVAEADARSSSMPFYLHKSESVLSQFPKPQPLAKDEFEEIHLPVLSLTQLIHKSGDPHYVKIDVEHYDHVLVRELFRIGCYPPYLSAEIHSWDVVRLLLGRREYVGYKLVFGDRVHTDGKAEIIGSDGARIAYQFPKHSAGPFGNDIAGPWFSRSAMQNRLRVERVGWKDLHASQLDPGEDIAVEVPLQFYLRDVREAISPYIPRSLRRLGRSLFGV